MSPATLSIAEAAQASGFTRQALYRALKDGRLSRWLIRDSSGHARLLPDAVAAIRSGVLRLRLDSAAAAPAPAVPPAAAPAAVSPLAQWVEWANALLDSEQWGPPPWEPTRWRTLEIVAAEAQALAEQWGDFDAEILAGLVEAGEL